MGAGSPPGCWPSTAREGRSSPPGPTRAPVPAAGVPARPLPSDARLLRCPVLSGRRGEGGSGGGRRTGVLRVPQRDTLAPPRAVRAVARSGADAPRRARLWEGDRLQAPRVGSRAHRWLLQPRPPGSLAPGARESAVGALSPPSPRSCIFYQGGGAPRLPQSHRLCSLGALDAASRPRHRSFPPPPRSSSAVLLGASSSFLEDTVASNLALGQRNGCGRESGT